MASHSVIQASDTGRGQILAASNPGTRALRTGHAGAVSRVAVRRAAMIQSFNRPARRAIDAIPALRSVPRVQWQGTAPAIIPEGRTFGLSGLAVIVGGSALLWALLGAGVMLLR